MAVEVVRVTGDLPVAELDEMLATSRAEGQHMIERLIGEWESGANRFDKDGEALFLAKQGVRIIGTGGRIVDPYAGDPAVARVRRVYVLPEFRKQGVARLLMRAVMNTPRFKMMRLRTESPAGCALYEALGFTRMETEGHIVAYQISL